MFAPTTCSSVLTPLVLRINLLRRGSTAWITALFPLSTRRSATQSPTAGRSARLSARRLNRPAISANNSPLAVGAGVDSGLRRGELRGDDLSFVDAHLPEAPVRDEPFYGGRELDVLFADRFDAGSDRGRRAGRPVGEKA